MFQYSLRKAVPEDAGELTDLLRGLGLFNHLLEETVETTRERIANDIRACHADQSHLILVAVDERNHVLGYTSVHWLPYLFMNGAEGYVSELFVRAEARGLGIGSSLLAEVKTLGRSRGCSRLSLLNNRTRESYLRHFYTQDGWSERDKMANFVYDFSKEI